MKKILAGAEGNLVVQTAQKADEKVFINVADNGKEKKGTYGRVPGFKSKQYIVHEGTSLVKNFST